MFNHVLIENNSMLINSIETGIKIIWLKWTLITWLWKNANAS